MGNCKFDPESSCSPLQCLLTSNSALAATDHLISIESKNPDDETSEKELPIQEKIELITENVRNCALEKVKALEEFKEIFENVT